MQKLKGTLIFSGRWAPPWLLTQEGGVETDLYPLIEQLLVNGNGRPARQVPEPPNSYRLVFDDTSNLAVNYEPGRNPLLEYPGGFTKGTEDGVTGMLCENIGAYLPMALTHLSGRTVEVTIDETGFSIAADPSEKVFGVKFFGDGDTSCRIPKGAEQTVCKVGTPECCIFLAAEDRGFVCEKFSGSLAEMLLGRHAAGTLRAKRVGNCTVTGREEDTLPADPITPCMSLTTPRRAKVLFNRPYSGWDSGESARQYLMIGQTYTVERLVAGDSSSEVFLKEKPGMGFNTVHFENVRETADA